MSLTKILRENEAELAADFRSKYGISIFDIGKDVTPLEAYLLISELGKDQSSRFFAKQAKWKRPVTEEWEAVTALHDTFRRANWDSKKLSQFEPLPRPYPTQGKSEQVGKIDIISQQQADAVRSQAEEVFASRGLFPKKNPPALPTTLSTE